MRATLNAQPDVTQMVGSEIQQVAYCIGYLQTVVVACIHLLFSLSLELQKFDQFLSTLTDRKSVV